MLDAIGGGINEANVTDGLAETPQTELDEVKKLKGEYEAELEFSKGARAQYAKDRNYAQGIACKRWASSANVIGAFIDILVSFLYAQNPDVSVRPAKQAGRQPDEDSVMFAETLEIVISRLWKKADMKRRMRRVVRSSLSVGPGWVKVLVYSEQKQNPQLAKEMSDVRDNLERARQLQEVVGDGLDPDNDAKITELMRIQQGLQAKVERLIKKGLCVDFVRADDMHVSLDISTLSDHKDADWNANDLYITKVDAKTRFKALTDEDLKGATIYYQRKTDNVSAEQADGDGSYIQNENPEGQYTRASDNAGLGPSNTLMNGGKPVEFVKMIELWDRRDSLIKTMVEGVNKWALEPYPPPHASTRFYPYFMLALFEVDGARNPQSLTMRLESLQDEYSHTRSNGRLTRERSVPGTLFNAGELSVEEVEKIQNSVHMEWIGIRPTTPGMTMDQMMGQKPVPRVDPALFDTMPTQRDMEVLSGVQEAQASGRSQADTATEAEINQSGFTSRTGADRDSLEDMLSEMAQYTAECAVQALSVQDVQKLSGPLSYWPGEDEMNPMSVTMEVDDLLDLMEVEIMAGTTGKPQARADKEAWATLMPLITNMIVGIRQAIAMGDLPFAETQRNLLAETLKRLDDRMSIDRILPPIPAPTPGPPGSVPMAPPPGLGDAVAGVEQPVGNGTVNNPATIQSAPPI